MKKIIIYLFLITLCSCYYKDEPFHRVWYNKNGMKIISKSLNDKNGGIYKYEISDNYGKILIRTDENWNVNDTLYITNHK